MNLEEAKANIGKEVVLDESAKPYVSNGSSIFNEYMEIKIILVDQNADAKIEYRDSRDGSIKHLYVSSRHLKLKEQPMNYKIRVTPETSAEVQKLFFELGFSWASGRTHYYHPSMDIIFVDDDGMFFREKSEVMPKGNYQEITLPQLRDMVVLKRNNAIDANQENTMTATKFYVSSDGEIYEYINSAWRKSKCDKKYLKPKEPNMTWQDALRAVADGKEVEVTDGEYWVDIAVCCIQDLEDFKGFRLAPQRITLHNSYTKEELLKIAGEME